MKKQQTSKSLLLSTEVVRTLADGELRGVVGGVAPDPIKPCPNTRPKSG